MTFATQGGPDLFAEEVEHASHTVGTADLRHQRRRRVGAAAWRRRGGGDDLRKAGAVHDGPGTVPVKRLPHGADISLPEYATALSAGVDLIAAVTAAVVLKPGARTIIPTGIAIQLPAGFEAQVRPRSGLAAKHGVTVLNSPGTIDADYRGEVGVILINHGAEAFSVERGMRIAQMVIAPIAVAVWQEVGDLDNTQRGAGGFGSTGTETAA